MAKSPQNDLKLSDYYPEMKDWTAVTPASAANKQPQLDDKTTTQSPILRATLPLSMIYSPDSLRQNNRPGVVGFRLSPVSLATTPGFGAAIQSTQGQAS